MGPALVGLTGVYLHRFGGDRGLVLDRLVRHMRDPDAVPALASRAEAFLAPMPKYATLPAAELEELAAYVLSLGLE